MKKIVFIHIALILLIAIPLYFIFHAWLNLNSKTDPEYRYETVTATEPRVYVTNTGDHYHNGSCGYLHSRIAKGRTQAIEEGYTACSACGGRPSGTITVTYQKRVPYDPTAKNIGGSIALAVFIAPLIYLFAYVIIKDRIENKPIKSTHSTTSTLPHPTTQIETKPAQNPDAEAIERIRNNPIEKIRKFIGERVAHPKYGPGTVTNIDKQYIHVRFDNTNEEKTFQFPEAFFKGYLSILE